jgi:hypothetical protein
MRWCCLSLSNRFCHLQFHIRYMSSSDTAITRLIPENWSEGLRFCREKRQVFLPGGGQDFSFDENRVAIATNTSLDSDLPYHSMVTLADSLKLCQDDFGDRQAWSNMKLSLCGNFTGVAIFQMAICRLLGEWHKRWDLALSSISGILEKQV